jgi:hypothetical protein
MPYCDPFPAKRNLWNGEPSINEMLDDPIVALVMARDGVQPEDLDRLIADLRRRLSGDDWLSLNN